jgi:zinc protease
MRTGSCLAALSVVGISCAATSGPPIAPGPRSGVSRAAPAPPERPALVNQATLGPVVIKKWRLGNGMEVILLPDATATSVTYMTWFRVGSRHEDAPAGETGLAHLFEHLMFTQTKGARESGEFDRRMEEVGAGVNAMTYYDFTAYVNELPPEALPVAVALEADRMVNLALTDEQVRTERDVVAEERLSSVEDNVDGLLDEMLWAQAFRSHPYRFPVIGLMKDIKAVTREKATRFYRTYYAPNNAVLVVAGRFEPEALLEAVHERYGPLPASEALPADTLRPERAPKSEVRAEVERPVPADRLAVGYPAPALGADDRAAFDVLDEILTGGPSCRLYRRLVVEKQIASSVDGGAAPTKDPGLYTLWVQMTKGHKATQAESIIDEEIAALTKAPVSEQELRKAKNRLETAFWRGLSSSEGRASQVGEFDVVAGDYRKLLSRAEEIARVTAEDVRRVAEVYLAPRARSVVVARPKPAAGAQSGSS